ncbi:MAG: hypothetical protein ACOYML_05835 [Microthrixaceae bacterium]
MRRTIRNIGRVLRDLGSYSVHTRRPGLLILVGLGSLFALLVVGTQVVAPIVIYPLL